MRRSPHRVTSLGLWLLAVLGLGSCSGSVLGHFTVTGNLPLVQSAQDESLYRDYMYQTPP